MLTFQCNDNEIKAPMEGKPSRHIFGRHIMSPMAIPFPSVPRNMKFGHLVNLRLCWQYILLTTGCLLISRSGLPARC